MNAFLDDLHPMSLKQDMGHPAPAGVKNNRGSFAALRMTLAGGWVWFPTLSAKNALRMGHPGIRLA